MADTITRPTPEEAPDQYVQVHQDDMFEVPPDPKPGWKTSEFWVTVVGYIFAAAALGGFLGKETAAKFADHISTIVGAVFALSGAYVGSRTIAKR